jgi:hypothetical protein
MGFSKYSRLKKSSSVESFDQWRSSSVTFGPPERQQIVALRKV